MLFKSHFVFGGEKHISFLKSVANRFAVLISTGNHVNITGSATANFSNLIPNILKKLVNPIYGHKYYICNSDSVFSDGQKPSLIFYFGSGVYLPYLYRGKDIYEFSSNSTISSKYLYLTCTSGTFDIDFYLKVIDLTLIYCAGNEPTTAAQFEADYQKWFGKPLTYEPYDAGSLKNVMLDGLKTIGFNQYNPTTGTANVIGGNQYQITGTYTSLTLNGETITPDSNGKFTPTIGGTLTVIGGSTDTCVHLVWLGTKDGVFEDYEENTISIPTTTMTGKLNGEGESVVIFPDGMKGVNDVHDEIYYVGGKTYAVKRVGRVDLGSLLWGDFSGVTSAFYANVTGKAFGLSNILCGIYANTTDTGANMPDKCIKGNNSGVLIYVKNTNYSDAATFKNAMSGVYLNYELAAPIIYEVDDFTLPARYKVNDWGTEEQLQASGANGIAAIISCLYGVNAVDILRNLPKNYISTESMDNFLAALGGAMGGTWTKTWNDNDDEYNFSFTANALTNSLTSNQEDI